jgi:site-specific DNA-cytosine methylase
MGDILERLSPKEYADLQEMCKNEKAAFAKEEKKMRARMGKPGKMMKGALSRTHGRNFLDKAWAYLKTGEPPRTSFCHACDKECPLHPPPEARAAKRYINIAGNTCVPWSLMGSREGWLHECTLVFLAWVRDIAAAEPQCIIQECTPSFDTEAFAALIGDKYLVKSIVFSPLDLGIPTRRTRQYSLCIRKDMLVFKVDWSIETMREIVWRTVACNARIYFRAPDCLKVPALDEMAAKRHLPSLASAQGRNIPASNILAKGDRSRLQAYINAWVNMRGSHLTFLAVNVKQSQEYYKRVDDMLPVLTTASALIWGRDTQGQLKPSYIDRPLLGYESYGAHGYPVLLPAAHPLTKLLPRLLSVRAMVDKTAPNDKTSKRFVGNGMHLSQVGLAVACALFGVVPRPVSDGHDQGRKRVRIDSSVLIMSHA